jgi:hypothetical protein
MMETREHSASHTLTAARRIPSIFLARTRPDTAAPLMTLSDDCGFDQCALLRWADDGGRWAGESNATLYGAHT